MKKNTFRNILFLTITLFCGFGVLISSAETAPYTIRIGILGAESDEDFDGALVFKDYIEARANGQVQVDIFTSGQFCSNERECIENMQSGVLDIFMTTIGGMGNLYGPGQVFDLPYVFRDDRVAECVFDGPIVDQLRQAVLSEELGLRLMVISNTGGWRNFATTRVQIKSPKDLHGLKIRTTSAPIQQELMRQLGANPTPVAWSETYTALATGVVEGTKNGIQDIVGMNFHEHIKYITLDGHAYMGALWWYSDKNWRKLPPELRRLAFDGFQHLKTVTRALPMRRQIEAYEVFRDAGGTIYAPDPAGKVAFQEATAGMRDWYTNSYGTEWLVKLDEAIAKCEGSVDAAFARGNGQIE